MRLIGKKKLEKLRRKNKGNNALSEAIDQLVKDIEENDWKNQVELRKNRKDANLVHSDSFYFFNILVHRIMILLEFSDYGEATIVWTGSHKEYETTFKNNKNTIRKWLRANAYIN